MLPYVQLERQSFLILCVYVCLLALPKFTSAAPTSRHLLGFMDSNEMQEKWKTPCGRPVSRFGNSQTKITKERQTQLVEQIINQANIAYSKASDFKDKFAMEKYESEASAIHAKFAVIELTWLRNELDKSDRQNMQFPERLYSSYKKLQIIAVCFDRMISDARKRGDSLLPDFEEQEKYVLTLLCEIETTMAESLIKKEADVEGSVMPEDLEDGESYLNLRNWKIIWEYVNILEFVRESFQQL